MTPEEKRRRKKKISQFQAARREGVHLENRF